MYKENTSYCYIYIYIYVYGSNIWEYIYNIYMKYMGNFYIYIIFSKSYI